MDFINVDFISPFYMRILATTFMIMMAVSVIIIRLKASNRPVTIKKIVMPPLGMATGFAMFVEPQMRIPILYGLIAFAAGWLLFSYPLIRTTHFEMKDGQVFAKRSSGFAFILIGLLVIRLLLHEVIEQYVSILQTGSLFFILAFGMIVRWRLYMLRKYRDVTTETGMSTANPEA
ncbi:CcdC family protein [Paenibacillus aceti]|uniref:Protein CcdC n=1 Tax=Paenibacillus aceti TaxID=1820010 RepID=A0ABQ1W640_9BACL|nr:cytochrome c biogenesis protein CcdC [Paenibacillus aceti]GGG15563.1 protein CcdC [Paenibacillus aceti]